MDEKRLHYAEDFGLLFEGAGMLGLGSISDPPERSAEELAGELGASRGSISQATRTLVRMGMVVRRVSRPGERRDYFRMHRDAWQETTRHQMALIGLFQKMADRGLSLIEPNSVEARRGFEEMPASLARWNEEKERLKREAR